MKRKSFIKQSILGAGGLLFLPSATDVVLNNTGNQKLKLTVNQHIRHGFYGPDRISNRLDQKGLESICIDLFKHPDQDFKLIELKFEKIRITLGLNHESIYIDTGSEITEIAFKKMNELIWSNHRVEIRRNPSNRKNQSSVSLFDDVYYPDGNAVIDKGESLYLIIHWA